MWDYSPFGQQESATSVNTYINYGTTVHVSFKLHNEQTVLDLARKYVHSKDTTIRNAWKGLVDADSGELKEDIKAQLNKSIIYAGDGRDWAVDRQFVADKLEFLQREYELRHCIKRISLYVPSYMLQSGIEIVDAPGTNDNNILHYRMLSEAIETADRIILFMNLKSLNSDRTLMELFSIPGEDDGDDSAMSVDKSLIGAVNFIKQSGKVEFTRVRNTPHGERKPEKRIGFHTEL